MASSAKTPSAAIGWASRRSPRGGRYHLYVSLACPWAHRTLIVRKLKGLESLVDVSVVSWLMRENGWTFDPPTAPLAIASTAWPFCTSAIPATTRTTAAGSVPLLWDKQAQKIVNNESADIVRIFNSAFDAIGANALDFYPEPLRGRSNASTDASILRSTTACTVPASPLARTPTRRPSSSCSRNWTTWKACSANAATWPANT